jgi:hypothetical protein
MSQPLSLQNLAWALTAFLKMLLLFCLLRRRLYRSHSAFFIYILATIVQTIVDEAAYSHWGFQSIQSYNIYWGSQGVVVWARWLAIVEIARKILANYSGIWRLANRLLFTVGIGVLAYSVLASEYKSQTVVLSVDRGVELSIAAFLVTLFLFIRYYRLRMAALDRHLAIGFSLYSCFWVIHASTVCHWGTSFESLRNFLDILTFLATLLLWIRAIREQKEAELVTAPARVSPETYVKLSLEANARLQLLNERLTHLQRGKDSRS